jgi:Fuc2NAc and GlcNAc transferase
MAPELTGLVLGCFVASAGLTQAVRQRALRHGILDVPNERSSHTLPTPRGGGVAVVITASVGFALLVATQRLAPAVFVALGGSLLVAAVGFIDDRWALSAAVRFAVHLAAAVWAVVWLGGLAVLPVGTHLVALGFGGSVFAVLGIVWLTNLFNFMDGIDGIAAAEAIFAAVAGGLLAWVGAGAGGISAAAWLFAAACAGFLCWNWPPARVFLGDVGSGYLGYVLAVLALAATREDPVAFWSWLILGGAFFVDATATLLRRFWRGERVYEPHRSHAYQWLARRWASHAKVTGSLLAVNLLWLLPCAWFATRHPELAAVTALIALTPLVLLAVALSGRRDAQ